MKQLLEFIPLILFFYFYKKSGIMHATLVLVIASTISFAILTIKEKKVAFMPLISALVIGGFGFLTWYFQDPTFIKMKPTIVNTIFSLVFITAYAIKKPFVKHVFGEAMEMPDNAWLTLSIRFGIFFLTLATINELIWRNFSEEFWVSFKVFGFLPISIIFTMSQLPFMLRHSNLKEKHKT
jgi:intracellular septation protein